MESTTTHSFEYPSMLTRVKAMCVDSCVVIGLMVLFTQISEQFSSFPVSLRIAGMALIVLYEPICVAYGCTAGNYLMKTRVRSIDDENQTITIWQSIIRFAVKCMLGWISFLTIHSNEQKRAMHDMAAKSVVVCVPTY